MYKDFKDFVFNSPTAQIASELLDDYKFLQWDLELGDCVFFDMRTLHGSLTQVTPKKNVHRYTLRMAKEGSIIQYRGDWAQDERAIMEANGYVNGDHIAGEMFPTLYSH